MQSKSAASKARKYSTGFCRIKILVDDNCEHGLACRHGQCPIGCISCQTIAFVQATGNNLNLPQLPTEIYVLIYKQLKLFHEKELKASTEAQRKREFEQYLKQFQDMNVRRP